MWQGRQAVIYSSPCRDQRLKSRLEVDFSRIALFSCMSGLSYVFTRQETAQAKRFTLKRLFWPSYRDHVMRQLRSDLQSRHQRRTRWTIFERDRDDNRCLPQRAYQPTGTTTGKAFNELLLLIIRLSKLILLLYHVQDITTNVPFSLMNGSCLFRLTCFEVLVCWILGVMKAG